MANKYFQLAVKTFKSFDKFSSFVRDCRVISATEGIVQIEFDVTKDHLNLSSKQLHEGCIASLIDLVTSAAIVTSANEPGVSINLAVSYPNCAKLGDTIIVNGAIWYRNKKLAHTRAEVRRKNDNLLIAYAQHTKVFPKKPQ
ncbi:Acyl-coenzyme A thioesterase [Dirofilaria immitis]